MFFWPIIGCTHRGERQPDPESSECSMVALGAHHALESAGRPGEDAVLRRLMAMVSLLLAAVVLGSGCDRPLSVPKTPEPGVPLLIFERTGGIAGFQDKLVIGYGGEYYLSRSGQKERIGRLGPDELAQLETWAQGFAPLTLRFEDNPSGPDNLIQQLIWTGLGTGTADEEQQQEMLAWAVKLLDELSAQ